MISAYIGLGSNLGEPVKQINKAIEQLKKLKNVKFISSSSFYESKPMGSQEQPDYINAVVEINTSLTAETLLAELQNIENNQGRVREEHWGPRTLDLDILLYGDEIINTDNLTIPHAGIKERNFVLYPLSELVMPEFNIPNSGKLDELLIACSMDGLKRLH